MLEVEHLVPDRVPIGPQLSRKQLNLGQRTPRRVLGLAIYALGARTSARGMLLRLAHEVRCGGPQQRVERRLVRVREGHRAERKPVGQWRRGAAADETQQQRLPRLAVRRARVGTSREAAVGRNFEPIPSAGRRRGGSAVTACVRRGEDGRVCFLTSSRASARPSKGRARSPQSAGRAASWSPTRRRGSTTGTPAHAAATARA